MAAAYWGHHDWRLASIPIMGFVIAATALAVALGTAVHRHQADGTALGEENTVVELSRGAAFGAMVGIIGAVL